MDRSQALQYIEQLSGQAEPEQETHRYALIDVDLISDALPIHTQVICSP